MFPEVIHPRPVQQLSGLDPFVQNWESAGLEPFLLTREALPLVERKRGPCCYTMECGHWQKHLQRKAQAQSGEVTYPRYRELGRARAPGFLALS